MKGMQIRNLSKSFGLKQAVKDLSFDLEAETIYGFLGANGAGKSTSFKLIANRLRADAGRVTLDGQEVWSRSELLSQIYLDSGDDWLPNDRLEKLFEKMAYFYGDFDWSQAKEFCQAFGLNLQDKIKSLSTGQKRAAKWIVAFCLPVSYIFLDEPLLGLDAGYRKLFKETLLKTYTERPRTFVVASHLVQEISPLLERIIVLEEGGILEASSIDELLEQFYYLTGPVDLVEFLCQDQEVLDRSQLASSLEVLVRGGRPANLPDQVRLTGLTLHDYMLYLTKKEGEEL